MSTTGWRLSQALTYDPDRTSMTGSVEGFPEVELL